MTYHIKPVKMATIKKWKGTNVGRYREKRQPLNTVGGNVNSITMYSMLGNFWERILSILTKNSDMYER
jgi:formylglycine-generating enzyme required for sulfatase activity